jgi:hypothetical protein
LCTVDGDAREGCRAWCKYSSRNIKKLILNKKTDKSKNNKLLKKQMDLQARLLFFICMTVTKRALQSFKMTGITHPPPTRLEFSATAL